MYREVHTVKGNASLIGLQTIVELTHSVESRLNELMLKETVKGDEYLGALVQLASLRKLLSEYREISDTVREGFVGVTARNSGRKESGSPLEIELEDFVSHLGGELGKKVYLRARFELGAVSDQALKKMKDIFIQASRNALVHGIETPAERVRRGKLEEGELVFICRPASAEKNLLSEPAYELTFRDDGAGLDLAAIRDRAVDLGLLSKDGAAAAGGASLANLIFSSGFSSLSEANEIAGRGVGMNLIKDIVVNEFQGKLSVGFAKGVYFQVSCYIPARLLDCDTEEVLAV